MLCIVMQILNLLFFFLQNCGNIVTIKAPTVQSAFSLQIIFLLFSLLQIQTTGFPNCLSRPLSAKSLAFLHFNFSVYQWK